MGGLTKTFSTSQGDITLARPSFENMEDVAAKVIPIMDDPTPLAFIRSPEAKQLLRSSVTDETKDALEEVLASDYIEQVELWNGYCEHGRFKDFFIWPLQREREKQLKEQAEEMAIQFAALIKHGIVKENMVFEMMQQGTSLLEQTSTSPGDPSMAGAAETSDEKTSG